MLLKKYLLVNLAEIIKDGSYKDAKSKFQEKAQEKVSITPSYKVVKETGPDHDKIFRVGIYFNDDMIAEGQGKSKQEAETSAAKGALLKKGWA